MRDIRFVVFLVREMMALAEMHCITYIVSERYFGRDLIHFFALIVLQTI